MQAREEGAEGRVSGEGEGGYASAGQQAESVSPPVPEEAGADQQVAHKGDGVSDGTNAGGGRGDASYDSHGESSLFTPSDGAPTKLSSSGLDADMRRRIRKRTAHGIGIYVICAIDYFLVFIHRLATAALGEELEHRFPGLGKEGLGVFSSLYFYLYAVAQPFCGIIVDLAKPRWTITTASAVMAVGSIIIGCVPVLGVAYFGRALVGLGAAFVYVPILKMTSLWFTPKKFALLAALMIAMGGLGGFLATIPLTALIDALELAFGGGDPANEDKASNGAFMSLFVGLGALSFIVAIIIAVVARDSPEQAGHPSLAASPSSPRPAKSPADSRELTELRSTTDQQAPLTTENVGHAGHLGPTTPSADAADAAGTLGTATQNSTLGSAASESKGSTRRQRNKPASRRRSGPTAGQLFVSSMKEVFTTKGTIQLILLMLGFFFFSGAYFTISASIGIDLLQNVVGMSRSNAALVQGCMNLATAAYGPVESVLADKFGRKRPYVANYAINIVIYLLLGIGCMYYRAAWYFIVLFLMIGAVPGTGIAIAYTMTKENFSLQLSGTSMGVFNIAPFLGGALFQNISPLLINAEAATDTPYVGYANMFWLLMAANVAGLILAIFTKNTHPQAV